MEETGVGVGVGAVVGAGRGGVVARDSDRLSRLRDLPVLPFDACDEGIANIMKWMAGASLSECLIAAVEYCLIDRDLSQSRRRRLALYLRLSLFIFANVD